MSEECFECSIAGAVVGFNSICRDHGLDCHELYELLEKEATPEEWISGLKAIRDRHQDGYREAFDAVLSQLCEALEGSPYACNL